MKNKIFSILLSVLVAFGLWLFVVTVEQPESEQIYYDIPVVLQNENILAERGLMITSEKPTVTLRLKSTRTNLSNLNESNINVIANVAGIIAPGSHLLGYDVSYPGNIPDNEISIQSSSTELFELRVEKRITKQVPVNPEYIGSVPDGMIAHKEEALLDYELIEVSGPESVMNRITQAKIQVDLEGQTETIVGEFAYTLCNEAGEPVDSLLVTTNAEKINLTLKIQRVKEIALTVKVIEGGGATEKTSTITIDPGTIRVSGSEALLDGLESIELGTIDLSTMLTDETKTFPIVLPEGVTNETGLTEATVEVKFPNLRTKKLSVMDIKAINVPKGMEVDMITKALEITVRGPVALINTMTASDLTVTVDFADAKPGTITEGVTITVDSRYEGVGAVGSYSVSVTVREEK